MATTLSRLLLGWRRPAIRAGISCHRGQYSSLTFSRSAHAAVERQDVRENDHVEAGSSVDVEDKLEEGLPFSTLKGKISDETLKAITVRPMQFSHMTPVQEAVLSLLPEIAVPPKLSEEGVDDPPRDLLVRAKTGTGKTLAFLVPAIEARLNALNAEGKRAAIDAGQPSDKRLEARAKTQMARTTVGALILSPTRELATQIVTEAMRLSHHHEGFEVRLLTGGISKRMQMRDWTRGRLDIVVATTGRLRDLMESEPEAVKGALKSTQMLILDEADTMLDMGFREDIDAIAQELPPTSERQTLLFSATVNRNVEQIARRIMQKKHAFINTITEDDSPVHAHVPQYHTVLPSAAEQLPHVLRLLAHDQLTNPGKSKVIMFLPTTRMTQLYASFLNELAGSILPAGRKTKIYEIHSRKSMDSRVATSDRFRKDKSGACVLVTSDVSARGVDYPGITRVVQVGIPQSTEQYIHRVGRTGRKGGIDGRGDLVLLPWEVGFVTWQLGSVPMKPLTTKELQRQVTELSAKFDEDPAPFFQHIEPDLPRGSKDYNKSRASPVQFKGPVTPRLSGMEDEIRELLATLDEESVRETVASLLGYYAAKAPELRVQKTAIVEGCKDWSVQACGLARPPYFSEAFLKRIGVNDRSSRNSQFGGSRDRTDTQRNRWESRGPTSRGRDRDDGDRRPSWRADKRDSSEFQGFAREPQSERFGKPFERRPSRFSYGDGENDNARTFKRPYRSEDGEERPSRERSSFGSRR